MGGGLFFINRHSFLNEVIQSVSGNNFWIIKNAAIFIVSCHVTADKTGKLITIFPQEDIF